MGFLRSLQEKEASYASTMSTSSGIHDYGGNREHRRELSKPADDEVVTIGTIKTEDIENHRSFVRVNDLTDAQKRFAPRDLEEFGRSGIGRSRGTFLIGRSQLHLI